MAYPDKSCPVAVTINKVLEQAARIRPDAYDDETKAGWLLSLEGQLYREVVLRHELLEGETLPALAARFPEDGDLPLLVAAPHEGLYLLYLLAQLDRCDREIEQYNNSARVFNEALAAWTQSYHRTHLPKPARGYTNIG